MRGRYAHEHPSSDVIFFLKTEIADQEPEPAPALHRHPAVGGCCPSKRVIQYYILLYMFCCVVFCVISDPHRHMTIHVVIHDYVCPCMLLYILIYSYVFLNVVNCHYTLSYIIIYYYSCIIMYYYILLCYYAVSYYHMISQDIISYHISLYP